MHYGMVCAGPMSEYLADKLPGLARELGPVAAATYRSASRIVNSLGAGNAVRTVDDLSGTRLVLICAPRNHLDSVVRMLRSSSLDWSNKSFLLCNSSAVSSDLQYFRNLGASIASVTALPVLAGRYVIEGDREPLRAARTLVKQLNGVPVEIQTAHVALFSAAQTFSGSLFTPLLHGCMRALRAAGISGTLQSQLLEALFIQQLRMYLYSGRKSWSGTVADGDAFGMAHELEALRTLQPELAVLYGCIAACAADALRYSAPPLPGGPAVPEKAG